MTAGMVPQCLRSAASSLACALFAYTPALMAKKNWSFHFVFSRNLWQDKEKMEDDLLRFIGRKMAQSDDKGS